MMTVCNPESVLENNLDLISNFENKPLIFLPLSVNFSLGAKQNKLSSGEVQTSGDLFGPWAGSWGGGQDCQTMEGGDPKR